MTALVQNMIMTALFEPFEALCSAANGEMVEVRACPSYNPLSVCLSLFLNLAF